MKKDNIIELLKNRESYLRKIAFIECEIKAIKNTNAGDIYSLAYPSISYEPKVQKAIVDPIPLQAGAIQKAKNENLDRLRELNEELFLLRQKVRRLESAVELLPEDQLQVMKLRFYEGATIKRTASDLLMSHSSVFNITKRAISNLSDMLN